MISAHSNAATSAKIRKFLLEELNKVVAPGSEPGAKWIRHRSTLWQLSVMRTPFSLPPSSFGMESAMQRRRFNDVLTIPDPFIQEAERLRAEAEKLPPGIERHELEREARQAETAAHLDQWLKSPGLRSPQ
jgi:hypothetical protein